MISNLPALVQSWGRFFIAAGIACRASPSDGNALTASGRRLIPA